MTELINKISSYNLFNYLFSGVLFVVLASKFTSHSFIQEDLVIGFFLYYFMGLVISRIGSLIVDPILKGISFVKFREYPEYVEASKKDPSIEVLSEANNTYRTLVAVCLSLLFLKIYDIFSLRFIVSTQCEIYTLLILLLVMFLFAYRKQTSYISKRIEKVNSK